ncbi:cytochrome P450 2F2-like [Phyllostomus hastatus]|uniref:cytochrome P450 2F2-like n=1 Tax=Phyllostomus hastatus TaxID=9423 RepID=UPI001E68316F|nr:cytochrome P450 2F2-like [Phyllostomus hastatus]
MAEMLVEGGCQQCLSESLVCMEPFLYFITILQNFSLQLLGAPENIDLTPLSSGLCNLPRLCLRRAMTPEPFQIHSCDPRRLLLIDNAASNDICSMVLGNPYGYKDPEFLRLLDLFNDNFRLNSRWGELRGLFPSILNWLLGPHHLNVAELWIFIRANPGNTAAWGALQFDCFLDQMDRVQPSHFQKENLVMTTGNHFSRSTETTHTTLILQFPEVACLCRGKLDTTVGQARLPGLEDHQRLPYTNTVLQETQRFIRVLPLGLSHTFACAATFSPRYPLSLGIVCKAQEHLGPYSRIHTASTPLANFLKGQFLGYMGFSPRICIPKKVDVLGYRPGLTGDLPLHHYPAVFFLLLVGSPTNTDLTPQCTGLGNVPLAFQLCLVTR